ncbi:MAG: hypothetical protein ACFFAJ_18635, partial [Candidatus Hodarchaeota archaeon]
ESNLFNILFICSGNIIRSPYAHLLFEHLIEDDRKLKNKLSVESGGVTYRNYSISSESRNELLKEGVSSDRINEFHPRFYSDNPDMFQKADLVLIMSKGHLRKIPTVYHEKTFLLLEFTDGISKSVPDPYFNPPFSYAYNLIKTSVIQLRKLFLEAY